jgi:hypothetical protein
LEETVKILQSSNEALAQNRESVSSSSSVKADASNNQENHVQHHPQGEKHSGAVRTTDIAVAPTQLTLKLKMVEEQYAEEKVRSKKNIPLLKSLQIEMNELKAVAEKAAMAAELEAAMEEASEKEDWGLYESLELKLEAHRTQMNAGKTAQLERENAGLSEETKLLKTPNPLKVKSSNAPGNSSGASTHFSNPTLVAPRQQEDSHEGWMWKEGARRFSSTRRRFFVLKGGKLRYYASPDGAEKGRIAVSGMKITTSTDPNDLHFSMKDHSLRKGRTFKFRAESASEKKVWIESLNTVCDLQELFIHQLFSRHA